MGLIINKGNDGIAKDPSYKEHLNKYNVINPGGIYLRPVHNKNINNYEYHKQMQ